MHPWWCSRSCWHNSEETWNANFNLEEKNRLLVLVVLFGWLVILSLALVHFPVAMMLVLLVICVLLWFHLGRTIPHVLERLLLSSLCFSLLYFLGLLRNNYQLLEFTHLNPLIVCHNFHLIHFYFWLENFPLHQYSPDKLLLHHLLLSLITLKCSGLARVNNAQKD